MTANTRNAKRKDPVTDIPRPMSDKEIEDFDKQQVEFTKAQIGASVNVLATLFATTTDQIQTLVYSANKVQGFWLSDQDNFASKIALVHSELSEALEADRKDITADDKIPEFSGVEAELADAVIRILDIAGRHNLRLGEAICEKLLYNLSRPYKHGKKY